MIIIESIHNRKSYYLEIVANEKKDFPTVPLNIEYKFSVFRARLKLQINFHIADVCVSLSKRISGHEITNQSHMVVFESFIPNSFASFYTLNHSMFLALISSQIAFELSFCLL